MGIQYLWSLVPSNNFLQTPDPVLVEHGEFSDDFDGHFSKHGDCLGRHVPSKLLGVSSIECAWGCQWHLLSLPSKP